MIFNALDTPPFFPRYPCFSLLLCRLALLLSKDKTTQETVLLRSLSADSRNTGRKCLLLSTDDVLGISPGWRETRTMYVGMIDLDRVSPCHLDVFVGKIILRYLTIV